MSFPTYPTYKDSGVEWLGEVPEHWVMGSLKNMAQIRNGRDYKEVESSDGEYPVIGSGGQFSNATQYLYEGESVLLGRKGTIDKPLYINGRFWTVDTMFYTEISKGACAKFFYYNSLTIPFGYYSTSTALPSMTQADLLNHPAAIPTKLEQTQIARFLDHETARIDSLIEEQQRLIELLKEKRQAVISHAVTKGLDPTVPMKDSGVEWLGEVPAHWESLTLGRVASSVKTGGTPSDDLPSSDIIDGVEWYTPGDFTGDLLLDSSEKRVSAGAVRSGDAKVFPSGSVLIVSIGATLGKVGHIRRPASANQQINAVVPGPRVDGYFLAYSLSVKINAMRFLSNASTIGIMNQEKTKEIWLSLPPLQEQKLITEFLDKQTSVIDTLIQEAAGGVALLQERRSALISAAVTGKIDVRGWQPPASSQAHESAVAEAV